MSLGSGLALELCKFLRVLLVSFLRDLVIGVPGYWVSKRLHGQHPLRSRRYRVSGLLGGVLTAFRSGDGGRDVALNVCHSSFPYTLANAFRLNRHSVCDVGAFHNQTNKDELAATAHTLAPGSAPEIDIFEAEKDNDAPRATSCRKAPSSRTTISMATSPVGDL